MKVKKIFIILTVLTMIITSQMTYVSAADKIIETDYTLNDTFIIKEDETLTINENTTLNISDYGYLVNYGTIINNGTITNNYVFVNDGTIQDSGTIDGDPILQLPHYSGGDGSKDNPYLLATKDDLQSLAYFSNYGGANVFDAVDDCGLGGYHGYYFQLIKDIDMEGEEWTPFDFCGTFDGNGHTISNMKMYESFFTSTDQTNYLSNQYVSAFFNQLVHANVKDIYFKNCHAKISDKLDPATSRDIYVAIVVGTAIASSFENISLIDCTVEQNGKEDNYAYAGGIAAIADICHFSYCSMQGGSIKTGGDAKNSQYAGGIVGAVLSDFKYYIDNYGNPYNMQVGNGQAFGVYNSFCTADITINQPQAVGGIVGWTISDYIDAIYENCYYSGNIDSQGFAGGIIGDCDSKVTINNCSILSETISAVSNSDAFIGKYEAINYNYITAEDCKISNQTQLLGNITNNHINATQINNDIEINSYKSNLYGQINEKRANIKVQLYQDGKLKYEAITDKDGAFNFGKDLDKGTYTLQIDEDSNSLFYSQEVSIPYATNVELNIQRAFKGADYSLVDDVIATIPSDLSIYTDESVKTLNDVLNTVMRDKNITEQDIVDGYANDIKKAINGLVYKDADYSLVDNVIATIPSDLSIYTDESVKTLNDVLNTVMRDKNITEQDIVDGYANDIKKAIDGLQLKTIDEENPTQPLKPDNKPDNKPTDKTEETIKVQETVVTSDQNQLSIWLGIMVVTIGYIYIQSRRKTY